MAFSLESRAPFLHQMLLKQVANTDRIQDKEIKMESIYYEAFCTSMFKDLIERPKQGFGILNEWIKGPLKMFFTKQCQMKIYHTTY